MSLSRLERNSARGQSTVHAACPMRSESPAASVSIRVPRTRNDASSSLTAGFERSATSMDSCRYAQPTRAYRATSASALR